MNRIPLELSTPETNLQAYRILYSLENALRELIIERLEVVHGPRWYKCRLPGDIFQSYKTGRQIERAIRWSALIPHHPIYYVDFPSLKKVIERKDNWKDSFEQIFQRKDIFLGQLSAVEPIRNKVAHNRFVDTGEVNNLRAVYDFLAKAVGEAAFAALATRSTIEPNLISRFSDLKFEGVCAIKQCRHANPLDPLPTWRSAFSAWWFDESFIGHDLSIVTEYFRALEDYGRLPRFRGSGHTIEKWVDANNLNTLFTRSNKLLKELVGVTFSAARDNNT